MKEADAVGRKKSPRRLLPSYVERREPGQPSGHELVGGRRCRSARRAATRPISVLFHRGGDNSWYADSDFEDIVLLLESHPELQVWLAGTPQEAVFAVAE